MPVFVTTSLHQLLLVELLRLSRLSEGHLKDSLLQLDHLRTLRPYSGRLAPLKFRLYLLAGGLEIRVVPHVCLVARNPRRH